jgi:hypothetical protein
MRSFMNCSVYLMARHVVLGTCEIKIHKAVSSKNIKDLQT